MYKYFFTIEEWFDKESERLNLLKAVKDQFPECMVEPDQENYITFLLPINHFSNEELKEMLSSYLYDENKNGKIVLFTHNCVYKKIISKNIEQSFTVYPIDFLKFETVNGKRVNYTLVDNFDFEFILKYNSDILFHLLNEYKPTNIPSKLKKIMMLL